MNATEQAISRPIRGPSWIPSGAAASAFVGSLVAVNVRVVLPDGSGELSGIAALAADPSRREG